MAGNFLDKLDAFAGGVDRPEVIVEDEHHTHTVAAVMVQVPHIDGEPAGEVATEDLPIYVHVQQLELAPREDLLYSQFDADHDPQIPAYALALNDLGSMVPPLYVLPLDRTITINSKSLPMYRVYDDPILFTALVFAKRARIKVVIPTNAKPESILLMALSREQHLRPASELEKCNIIRRLADDYGMDYPLIARHIKKDKDTGEEPSKQYLSARARVSRLAQKDTSNTIANALHRGLIFFSHARSLCDKHVDGQPEIAANLVRLILQKDIRTVGQLEDKINEVCPEGGLKPTVMLAEDGGRIVERSLLSAPRDLLHLTPDHTSLRKLEPVPYPVLVTKTALIRKEATKFNVTVIAGETRDTAVVAPQSFDSLVTWLSSRNSNTPIRDVESVVYGFMQAMRQAADEAGALNPQPAAVDHAQEA